MLLPSYSGLERAQAWSEGGYSDDLIVAAKCAEAGMHIHCPSSAIFRQVQLRTPSQPVSATNFVDLPDQPDLPPATPGIVDISTGGSGPSEVPRQVLSPSSQMSRVAGM